MQHVYLLFPLLWFRVNESALFCLPEICFAASWRRSSLYATRCASATDSTRRGRMSQSTSVSNQATAMGRYLRRMRGGFYIRVLHMWNLDLAWKVRVITSPSKSKASFYLGSIFCKLVAKFDLQKLFVEMVERPTLLRKGRLLLWQL